MAFNLQANLMKVQGNRNYLPVAARVVWFRERRPDWAIHTEILTLDHGKQFAVFRATVKDASGRTIATATKKEDVKGFGDYLEKAETGAIGRALGMCGFSTDGDPDFDTGRPGDEAHIVDTPQQPRRY